MIIDYDYLATEYMKCFKDKSRIYMIQNYLKTFDNTQKKDVPFKLFPKQAEMCMGLAGFDKHMKPLGTQGLVVIKSRQQGATTTTGAYIACEMCLADKEMPQTVLAIGNTLDLSQQMLFKIRDFLLQFPLWMWGDEFMDIGYNPMEPPVNKNVIFERCNSKELVLKNGCKVVARSSGPDASRGVGGVQWLIFDEAAFIENGKDVYASALPTVSTGGKIVMVSTCNGKDQLYYETYRRSLLKGTKDFNNFSSIKLHWAFDGRFNKFLEWVRKDKDTGETYIQKENYLDDEGTVKYDEDRWEKMMADGWKPRSPWYIKMCQQFNNDPQKIAQELDISFMGSASNVVDPEFIEMQQKLNMREPLYCDDVMEDTWIWKEPIPGHRYLMSIDASRGDASDSTALEIIDMDGIDDDGKPCIEQVLEYNGKMRGDDLGELAYRYGETYNFAFCVVDCVGGTGDACVLMMERLKYPALYYDDPQLKKYSMQQDASSVPLTSDGRLPGFHSSSVRFQMLTNFANMVKTNQLKIRSKRVIAELDTWIYKGTAGRIDHMDGCHDDTLTCLAMGLFVMQYSLQKYIEAKNKTAVILKAWKNTGSLKTTNCNRKNGSSTEGKKFSMPLFKAGGTNIKSPYKWLIR